MLYISKFQEFETVQTLIKIQKKRSNFDQKLFLKINNYEKTNKTGGTKKEGNLPKPLPSFSFFRPLLSLLPTTIYIKKTTCRRFGALRAPSS